MLCTDIEFKLMLITENAVRKRNANQLMRDRSMGTMSLSPSSLPLEEVHEERGVISAVNGQNDYMYIPLFFGLGSQPRLPTASVCIILRAC